MEKESWNYQKCYELALQCSCAKEMKEHYPKALYAAQRNKWTKDYTWFKRPDGNHATWTRQEAEEESKKYSCRKEFQNGSRGAYKAALREGWLDDFVWLKTPEKEHLWTFESCKAESEKYRTPTEFKRSNPSAYNAAARNKWFKDLEFADKQIVWNEENCRREAEKYTSRSAFENGNASAYLSAHRNGWIDSYTWLTRPVVHNKKWTKESCEAVARAFLYKEDFRTGRHDAYMAAVRMGWMKEFDWFKPKAIENLDADKSKYTVYIYKDNINKSCYIGLTNNLRTRHNRHKNQYRPSVVYTHFTERYLEIPYPEVLKENLTSEEARYYEDYYVKRYREEGWDVLNIGATGVGVGSFGGGRVKYTHEKATEIAMGYDTLRSFYKEQASCYARCRKMGWLKEFTWLKRKFVGNNYWDEYKILEESQKFDTLKSFREGSKGCYGAAKRLGLLDKLTWLKRG